MNFIDRLTLVYYINQATFIGLSLLKGYGWLICWKGRSMTDTTVKEMRYDEISGTTE